MIKDFDSAAFTQRSPFPWYNFQSLLTEDAFAQLYDEFPSLDFFEKHEGLSRDYGQRSHDRYYLAYEKTIYKDLERDQKGIIHHAQLSPAWQAFITRLQTDPGYLDFIHRCLA